VRIYVIRYLSASIAYSIHFLPGVSDVVGLRRCCDVNLFQRKTEGESTIAVGQVTRLEEL
jgi:hypothetical protein